MKIKIQGDECKGFVLRNEIVEYLRKNGVVTWTDVEGEDYVINIIEEEK